MRTPISTYRLQIRESFTLYQAAALVPYFKRLGVDWLYLSPLLKAADGSDHGYDMTDPSLVDPARGGAEGLVALAWAAHRAGLGILVDLVPNHMGVADAGQNPWWWQLLRDGRESAWAEAFDVDWAAGGGKVRIPVLGDGDGELDRLRLEGSGDSAVLCYAEHRFPVTPGSNDDGAAPRTVHGRQHYELMNWRRADAELNYRRFFAVNTLAGVRVEVPWVFDQAHALPLRWIRTGVVDGLRIDHPDGLADPEGYLARLRRQSGGAYTLVEKILEPGETLPPDWQCEGTTGYDALALVDRLFTDPAGVTTLGGLDTELRGTEISYPELVHGTKRSIADGILRSEVLRLARLVPADAGLDAGIAADALAELLATFPVYRSYLPYGRDRLDRAGKLAAERRPELADAIETLLPLVGAADADRRPAAELPVRFQQSSGMVMAKGAEDTAFYRYTRLTSLTEVGADPAIPALAPARFHDEMRHRRRHLPLSMTTLSTHDTKRGEDVRARISVLSEVSTEWAAAVRRLAELAPLDDGPLANLLWQAVVGAWPASRGRLHAYAEKAAREAGNSTTWTAPDEAFERDMHRLIDAVFDNREVSRLLKVFATSIQGYGWSNSLAAKLVQLTMPGVPDVYQGSEFWENSLVDPDNRRPVNFERRRRKLALIDAGLRPAIDSTGAAKMLVTSRALRLRRDRPELFTGYEPVETTGNEHGHLFGFDRGGAITLATRLPVTLARRGGWQGASVILHYPVLDELTGATFRAGRVRIDKLFARYPVALLARTPGVRIPGGRS